MPRVSAADSARVLGLPELAPLEALSLAELGAAVCRSPQPWARAYGLWVGSRLMPMLAEAVAAAELAGPSPVAAMEALLAEYGRAA